MTTRPLSTSAIVALLRGFRRDHNGASAIEFAIVATPFLLLIVFIMQIGVYYMTQMSLDTGVIRASEDLRAAFNTGNAPSLPSASALKTSVANYSGGLVSNNSTLAVEVQPLVNLDAARVPITNGTANYGTANTVLVIRASYSPLSFMPGFGANVIAYSSALVRRQSE